MPTETNLSAEVLRKLHRIHRQLTDLRSRLERGPKQMQVRETNVTNLEKQLTQIQADAKAFRVATDEKQLLFKTKEGKIRELKVKLNTAESNREYQALKEQIAADEMANSVLADEILEALERIDNYQKEVGAAAEIVKKAKDETEKSRKELQEKEPGVRTDVERLTAELRETEAALPDEVREAYLRVVRQKGEEGLAPMMVTKNGDRVTDGFCGGCHQQMPINLVSTLRMGRPVFCKSCGCLLYEPEDRGPTLGDRKTE